MTAGHPNSDYRCFKVEASDNVATLLCGVAAGDCVTVHGASGVKEIVALESIALGHKVALEAIPEGALVVKYGVPIGVSTAAIRPGEYVHLHNCRSQVDERSSHLDQKSGAAKDTPYD